MLDISDYRVGEVRLVHCHYVHKMGKQPEKPDSAREAALDEDNTVEQHRYVRSVSQADPTKISDIDHCLDRLAQLFGLCLAKLSFPTKKEVT